MTQPSASAPTTAGTRATAPGALFALLVLTAMNLLNYVDRYVPSAVKDLIKGDLKLSDQQTSLPLTAFLVVYMFASPAFGALAERYDRRKLVAFGVVAWSLATAAAALAQDFWTLLVARAAVGIGEAAYATLAPSILADFYPPERRNRAFTMFYVAIPVGSALGYAVGGVLGEHFGWRAAFLAVGLPGILAALLALAMKDPVRGQFDPAAPKDISYGEALRSLRGNRLFLATVAGYTAVTFATGGIADWFPTFLNRVRGLPLGLADTGIGAATVVGGIVGTLWGGWAAEWLAKHTRQPYLALSGLSMLPAVVLSCLALFVLRGAWPIIGSVLTTQLFLWAYNAPVNALLVNSVAPELRARAFGLSILAIHLGGDALSPPIIGAISDATGNLELALLLVPVTIAVGGLVWLVSWRKLPEVAIDKAATAPGH